MTDRLAAPLFHLVVPEPPSANRYWRSIAIRGQVRVLLSAEARRYRIAVREAFERSAGWELRKPFPHVTVHVTLAWYRSRRSGDLDNRIKQVLDAVKGMAYDDDDQVVSLAATRHDDPSRKGEVEVWIWAAGPQDESQDVAAQVPA